MKLIIDIPTEFETDYKGDKFKDFFSRVLCDIEKGVLCGNYEKEAAEMFLKAFDESIFMDNIVEKLEEYAKSKICDRHKKGCPYSGNDNVFCENCGALGAINILKQEIGAINNEPTNN